MTCEKERDNMMPNGKTAGENVTDGNLRKNYPDVVITDGACYVLFAEDSEVKKTDKD